MVVGKGEEVVGELHKERLLEESPALGWGECGKGWTGEHGSGASRRRGTAKVAGDEEGLAF